MACNWLPHNLNEVAECIERYIDGKEYNLPGPDFPTGGIITNMNDIPNIMKTGHGSVKVRARHRIEKQNIIFYEIPYGTTIENLIAEIGKVCDDKEVEGVNSIRDESGKKGLKIVVECDKNVNPENIAVKLFQKTNLQTSISYNQVALVDKTPTELNLEQCLKIYVEHNIKCLKREAEYDIEKAKARLNIVEGLLIALEDIDNVIAKIKASDSAAAAKERLISDYGMNEAQAKAVLDMKLAKLAKLEKIEVEKEKHELERTILELEYFLSDRDEQTTELKNRLNSIVRKFGDKRRTELAQIELPKEEKEIEAVIPEDCVVIVSQTGDIKRVPKTSFKVQKRNGKGIKTEDDALLASISTNTIDNLMIFTNSGKMYKLLVDSIPVGTNASRGVNVATLVKMDNNEKAIAITSLDRKTDAEYVVFITKKGLIKKTLLSEYTKTKRTTGIAAVNIKDGDTLANVLFMKEEDIIIITKNGMSIKFATKDINPVGRVAAGVKSIKLDEDDEVVVGIPIINEQENVAIFTSNGYGKKVALSEFPIQGRAGKGVYAIRLIESKSSVIGAAAVNDDTNILLIGKPNSICVNATELPLLTRIGLGNIMIKAEVKSIVKI